MNEGAMLTTPPQDRVGRGRRDRLQEPRQSLTRRHPIVVEHLNGYPGQALSGGAPQGALKSSRSGAGPKS
jgi:hypothetical protein